MRRRFQKPRIKNKQGYWIAQYRDLEGKKRKVSLGSVAKTKKADAETKLARLLEPLNTRLSEPASNLAFGTFVRQIYFPFYGANGRPQPSLAMRTVLAGISWSPLKRTLSKA